MRRRTTRHRGTVLLAAGLAVAACSADEGTAPTSGRPTTAPAISPTSTTAPAPTPSTPPSSAATTPTTDASPPPTITWRPCGPDLECGRLAVPLDHDDPTRGEVSLAVVRRLADDPARRIGSLLVNPGGPGFGGTVLVENAEFIYGSELLDRFDIVGWDPRGTGQSEPRLDCVDEWDSSFGLDPSPDDPGELDALATGVERLVAGCVERSRELLPHVSTVDSARDMDLLRQALGEDEISYFGFSYGSELGARWVTSFPDTVRAAVLDGAVDPTADAARRALDQATGFEAALTRFLTSCGADPGCAIGRDGDPAGAFDALLERLDAQPLVVDASRTPVTQGVALIAIVNALYSAGSWPLLAVALDQADGGDGAGLLDLYDSYLQRRPDGSYGDELDAYLAITCVDHGPGFTGGTAAGLPALEAAAPRLGAGWVVEVEVCARWPVPARVDPPVTGAGAGPVLVVGTTGDAATPLASSQAMAEALDDGHLVVADAEQHTGYGTSECIDDAVDRYLVDLVVPPAGLVCAGPGAGEG